MSRPRATRAQLVGLALSGALVAGCVATAPKAQGEDCAESTSKVAEWADRSTDYVRNMLAGMDARPMIERLRSCTYVKSNEAIGDARDIADRRVSHGLVPMPRLTQHANRVLDKLKAASGVKQVPGKVYVVANDQLEAGSTPDGNIFVALGYFRNLESEDQLAALLGHELSHVLLHHHDSDWFSRMQKQTMSYFEDGSALRNTLERAVNGGSTGANALSDGQKDTLDRMNIMVKLTDRALQPAWGRRQEAEADRLGADLMMRAGYSFTDGVQGWLLKVAAWDKQQKTAREEAAVQRRATIDALAQQGKLEASARTALDGALKDVLEDVGRDHQEGDARLREIDGYVEKAYKNQIAAVEPNVAAHKQVMTHPDVKGTLDGYREAFVARNQIVDLKHAAALGTLRRLTSGGPIASHALPNHLLFEAQRSGRGLERESALRRSLAAAEPTWEPVESAANYFESRNRKTTIVEVGREALRDFNEAPSAYPRLIGMYTRYGLKDEAAKVAAECHRTQAQMRSVCDRALKR